METEIELTWKYSSLKKNSKAFFHTILFCTAGFYKSEGFKASLESFGAKLAETTILIGTKLPA